MSKGLEALEELRENGAVSFSKGTISFTYLAFTKRVDIIEKELKRLGELEKAFDSLSKEDEKAKKLLSLEIEKNRALEIIFRTRLNVGTFLLLCKGNNEFSQNTTYEQYCYFCDKEKMHQFPCYKMTKEEYELVLGVCYGKKEHRD